MRVAPRPRHALAPPLGLTRARTRSPTPGAGTYTPAMASVFNTVTCVEFNIRLVQAARENAERNNVSDAVG